MVWYSSQTWIRLCQVRLRHAASVLGIIGSTFDYYTRPRRVPCNQKPKKDKKPPGHVCEGLLNASVTPPPPAQFGRAWGDVGRRESAVRRSRNDQHSVNCGNHFVCDEGRFSSSFVPRRRFAPGGTFENSTLPPDLKTNDIYRQPFGLPPNGSPSFRICDFFAGRRRLEEGVDPHLDRDSEVF